MKKQDIETLIRLGFTPSSLLKRSTWSKVTRIMDWFVDQHLVLPVVGEVKYRLFGDKKVTDSAIAELAATYMASPLSSHLRELRVVAASNGLRVNDGRTIVKFVESLK